ncbi:glycosyltransferase family 2 protein [Nonlabens tegetincola]|uniref:glycosyltransferase family 2 protein n=1 Tax=Nonlabens tegetincola TaxID=323273 RepID=UPI0005A8E505|nr:glycosyltransferase family 2 protein [Nonlabens tegetincola]
MQSFPIIRVIIPAYNEQDSIGHVIKDIPKIVTEVVVCSNNSSDDTVLVARNAGATVVEEPNPGYGNACLKAMDYIAQLNERTDIIVFLDGDYSDYPEQLIELVNPIINDDIDVVIGARVSHLREKGSMTLPQIFGNWLATTLMKWMFASKFTDLGPFRAIKYDKLLALNMQDKTYGWTVELQLKALKNKYTYCEIPMKYRNRIGVSKVSGTVKGAIFAGVKILTWIFKYGIRK